MIGKFVIVRTYSAGVHTGFLSEVSGRNVVLTEARRIRRWRGANTLNEMFVNGCDETYTQISEPVELILLTEAIEVIPCQPKAVKNLRKSRWSS